MHILVVNDDGPPSPHSSPYVHSLVRELQAAGHDVSVCLPNTQRSWIGKAHIIGQTVKPTYYRPPPASAPPAGLTLPDGTELQNPHGTTHSRPSTVPDTEEWILVDGTPASCVQIGLHHFFQDRGPIDLVLSGPNFGRNTTALFALSSGTLGGALEAAVCRRKAIALSYAFFNNNHDPSIIAAATRQSVKVVEALMKQWPSDGSVDLYSINVPLLAGLESGKVLWTEMLQNYWTDGSCFTEVDGSVDGEDEEEELIRVGEGVGETESAGKKADGQAAANNHSHKHKHFKWSPRFADVYRSVEEAPPGNDGWAVKEGHTSVTPLKANFFQSAAHLHGKELQLGDSEGASAPAPEALKGVGMSPHNLAIRGKEDGKLEGHTLALIAYDDDYVQPLIIDAMRSIFPAESWTLVQPPEPGSEISLASIVPNEDAKILQITPYETIDFGYALAHPRKCLVNSYIIRKALIRKHFLSATVDSWAAKHPDSILKTHVKRSEAFEVDYAEFLDDALVEAFDLRASLERNAGEGIEESGNTQEDEVGNAEYTGAEGGLLPAKDREWWILKPSMSDRGQGIRLFSTMEELQAIFDEWEEDMPDSDDEGDEDDEAAGGNGDEENEDGQGGVGSEVTEKDNITTSHLRHFIAQPYIDPPMLLPQFDNRKFHIRTYVLAVGSLRVYVYKHMLALFAAKTYQPPWATAAAATNNNGNDEDDGSGNSSSGIDLDAHLTNTCIQGPDARPDSVARFWDLPLPALGRCSPSCSDEAQTQDDIPKQPQQQQERKHKSSATHEAIFAQICQLTGEVFEAAARGMMVHFQPLEGAFEVYGLDFLVDARGAVWLLEVNAFPDFKQTGDDAGLRDVVAGFWADALRLAVGPFVTSTRGGGRHEGIGVDSDGGVEGDQALEVSGSGDMVLVKSVDLGRR